MKCLCLNFKKNKQYSQNAFNYTIAEFVYFIIFLINISIVAYNLAGPSFNYFSNMMKNSFIERSFETQHGMEINFHEISTNEDFWYYLKRMANKINPEDDDDDGDGNDDKKKMRVQNKPMHQRNIAYKKYDENLILSAPRIRQIRVRNNSCMIHKLFQKQFNECYGHYSKTNEDRTGLQRSDSFWEYHEPDYTTDEWFTWGLLAMYPGGGYVVNLNCVDCIKEVDNLKTIKWIDRGTRAVFIEFTIYNGNVNIFCIVKIIAEFPSSGGVVPSFSFRTVKLLRFLTNWDYVVFACEIVLSLQVIYYIIEEMMELCCNSFKYFLSFWNLLDLSIIIILTATLIFSALRYFLMHQKLEKMDYQFENKSEYVSFGRISFWQSIYNQMMGIAVFLVWIKVLKFISFNRTMLQFNTTLKRCAKDLFGFALMFAIVFVAFAHFGFMLFGTENPDFQSFKTAIFTAMRMILGDFDYLALERTNRVFGPIYFLLFIFFVFFILLNMFLAIVNDTYSEVKAEKLASPNIKDWFLDKFQILIDCNWCSNKKKTFEENEQTVKKNIEEIMDSTFEKNENQEFKEIFFEIRQKYDFELVKLKNKVNILEKSIECIIKRMDRLITRIEIMRRAGNQ